MSAAAPDPLPALAPRWLRFGSLTADQGLSSNLVRTIVQDRAGFLWFDTLSGLNRYDGVDVVVYRHDRDDPTSLSGDTVHATTSNPFPGSDEPDFLSERPPGWWTGPRRTVFGTVLASRLASARKPKVSA